MDFQKLLNIADYNKTEAVYEASISRYSTDLPPPKKMPKASVKSEGIAKFLAKRKAEEEAKAAEAKKKKEQLLAIRSQNSKNNKKAKIMASRTKDNDFSKIKLSEDEIEAKRKREAELVRKNLANKVERMKERIEMERKEQLLPKKRKRKSKNIEHSEDILPEENLEQKNFSELEKDKIVSMKSNNIRKNPKAPPPSFMELLKIAEKKQHEPVEIIQKKKEVEKPMTKKERQLKEEELQRLKRKEKLSQGLNGVPVKSCSTSQKANASKKLPVKNSEINKPVVIHIEKEKSKPIQNSSKLKSSTNTSKKSISSKETSIISSKNNTNKSSLVEKFNQNNHSNEQKKNKFRAENSTSINNVAGANKSVTLKKNDMKTSSTHGSSKKSVEPNIDEDALTILEKRIREKLEKEFAAKFALYENKANSQVNNTVINDKVSEAPKSNPKKEPTVINLKSKNVPIKSKIDAKDMGKFLERKKCAMEQKRYLEQKSKLPEKKVFHKNPYLDPPRRLLESQRPSRLPVKRRIESDDDDDDDDDMSDFIDDRPSQNDEDYSKYIKEIFGYDRSRKGTLTRAMSNCGGDFAVSFRTCPKFPQIKRHFSAETFKNVLIRLNLSKIVPSSAERYVDDDEDDIKETSFAEQMKEEIQSAKVGYLEDLEEERKEMARKKKKKLKS